MLNLITTILAIWGAALSTLLCGLKVHEILQKGRLRIEVEGAFVSLPEVGDIIYIRNLGSKAIMVTYWEVVSFNGRWPRRKERSLRMAGNGYPTDDIRIEALDSTSLLFQGSNYFDGMNKKLYLRLWLAGRAKPVLKRVRA